MTEWRVIQEFPHYSVSDTGFVRKDGPNERIMARLVNQRGIVNVGLTKNGVQYKRSVAHLVAQAFVPVIDRTAVGNVYNIKVPTFDTPIHLDGDKFNNGAWNLAWRPRWFALKYLRQFREGPQGFGRPIQDMETEQIFPNSFAAAIANGLLEREVVISIMTKNYTWPTFQQFRIYSDVREEIDTTTLESHAV